MRVVTFNIQHGRGATGRVDVGAVAAACAGLGADLLALQEVDVGAVRSGRVDTVAVVAEATGLDGHFGPATRMDRGRYGNALFSRTPLRTVRTVPLPRLGRHEPRAMIVAELDDGWTVAATHLSVVTGERPAQLAALRDVGADLVVGDLNETFPDLGARLRLLDGPPTFPRHAPRARIDHVAVAPGWTVERSDVVDLGVSDHRAVVVDLEPPTGGG